jgi:methyl-accepting chemotaxis protein
MSGRKFWLLSGAGLAVLCLAVGLVWNHIYMSERVQMLEQRLVLLRDLRRGALEQYFETAEVELRFWSISDAILEAQRDFITEWEGFSRLEGNPSEHFRELYVYGNPYPWQEHKLDSAEDGSFYSEVHKRLHPLTKLFVLERGYYDFFLIGPQGDVFYSVAKEADFATNLASGPWKDSSLAQVWRKALAYADEDRVAVSDMSSYAPSDGDAAIFMAQALRGRRGEKLGVIAFQLPTERIVEIMNFSAGMGETGETYLVGEDLMMRSNSRFVEETTILQTRVDTPAVHKALAGEDGTSLIPDYRGIEVMSAYGSTGPDDANWAVLAEMDHAEVRQWAASERPAIAAIMSFIFGLGLWTLWYAGRADFTLNSDLGGSLDFDAEIGEG